MSDLSRVEQLLRNALGEDIYEVTPQSRVEVLLQQLNELIEDIGGGSVDPEVITAWLAENIHDGAVVDSSLTVEGAAADSKKTGTEISQLKEDFNEKVDSRFGDEYSPNLVESDESMTAGYISKDGAFHSLSSMKYTDFIPVKSGWVLTAHVLNSGVFMPKSLRFVACYDESKTVVSSAGSNTSISSFTVPDGIAYVIVTFDGSKQLHRVHGICQLCSNRICFLHATDS